MATISAHKSNPARVFVATDRPDDLEGLLAYIDRNFELVIAASRSEVLADADLRSAVAVVFTEQPSDVDARDFCRRIDPRWQNRPKVVAAGSRGAAWTSFVDHQVPIDGMIYLDDPDDQQIGALIAEGAIDALIFFPDPLTPMPHDVDVKALLRLTLVYDIPCAFNPRTADMLVAGGLLDG